MFRKYVLTFVFIVACSSPAWSWGGATHKFINKEAAIHLPRSVPFFANNIQWISDHAPDADNRKNSDPNESPKHFIDIEDYPEFATHTLSHNYDTLVSKHGLAFVINAGTVPWAIIWSFDSLTNALRRGDSVAALQFAADLGHYVGDAHQPLHVTSNYDGQKSGNSGIHSRYESTMLQTYNYLNQVTVSARQVHSIPVPIDTNFVFILHGNGLVDSILHADNYAKAQDSKYGSTYYAALWQKTGAMTQNQIADASYDLACLWYTAAVNAGLIPDTLKVISMLVSPSPISFGNLEVGRSKDTTISVSNRGTDTLRVNFAVVHGGDFSLSAFSAGIPPGRYFVDTLRFTPAKAGPESAQVLVTNTAGISPDTILVTGVGQSGAKFDSMIVSPTLISFGKLSLGNSEDTTISVENRGTDTLHIDIAVIPAKIFSVLAASANIAPGGIFVDTLRFTSVKAGPESAMVVVTGSVGILSDTISVTGLGQIVEGVGTTLAGSPSSYQLSDNFPNPFNPSTTIRYALPSRSTVHLRVYNMLGQAVADLVSGVEEAGYREVVWNASAPSGVYFCRIEASSVDSPGHSFSAVRKMLLLK